MQTERKEGRMLYRSPLLFSRPNKLFLKFVVGFATLLLLVPSFLAAVDVLLKKRVHIDGYTRTI